MRKPEFVGRAYLSVTWFRSCAPWIFYINDVENFLWHLLVVLLCAVIALFVVARVQVLVIKLTLAAPVLAYPRL